MMKTHLKAAGEPAAVASQRPVQVDNLVLVGVHDAHVKRAPRAAAVPRQATRVFDRVVNLLAHRVLHRVLVLRLEPDESCNEIEREKKEIRTYQNSPVKP
jgi:hypothetical protein